MSSCRVGLVLFLVFISQLACAATAEDPREVNIADPYLEVRTGPGRGYPVFHVAERDARITILFRKTQWFKVQTPEGKIGWVDRTQMSLTLTPAGERTQFVEITREQEKQRIWEWGVMTGNFDSSTVISVYGGYAFNELLAAEFSISHILGIQSSSYLVNLNLVSYMSPSSEISPFFTLGVGILDTNPHDVLVSTLDRTDTASHFGFGARMYLTERFVMRGEYKSYVIYLSQDNNKELDEWKLGITAFF